MTGRLPPRYAIPVVGVLFAVAGAKIGVEVNDWHRAAERRAAAVRPPPPLPRLTFAPPPAADLLDDDPTPADRARVDALIGQLGNADGRARSTLVVEALPFTDLPLLEAAAARPGPAADVLATVMPRVRARDALARRRSHSVDDFESFYEREAIDEYAAGHHRSPRWDDPAQRFLHWATIRMALHRPAALRAAAAEARRQLQLALDAGCNDPTVLAAAGLLAVTTDDPTDATHGYFARADQQVGAGPLYRFITDARLLRPYEAMSYEQRKPHFGSISGRLCDLSDQFNRLLRVPGLPPAAAVRMAGEFFDRVKAVGYSTDPNVAHVWEPLAHSVPAGTPGLLAVKGQVYTEWAWDARGRGAADDCTPQGWRDFHARLAVAEAALTAACAADPGDPAPPTRMVEVAGVGEAGGDALLGWYRRAMAVDPDDAEAVAELENYLEPKWGGDPDALLGFGRQCLAEGNWHAPAIPLMVVRVHDELAAYSGDPDGYWCLPGVWDDVRAALGQHAVLYPRQANEDRTRLALYALRAHQWAAADVLFDQLAGAADPAVFGSRPALDAARRLAHRKAIADAD